VSQIELEITPEPSPDERAAIEAALNGLTFDGHGSEVGDAWWRAGLCDADEETGA
jgi:hypothetical protein